MQNKKEDVIDIILTSYGKNLYAKGIFEPEYYSFHDDDIIYDRNYIGLTENIDDKLGNYSIDKRIVDSFSFNAQCFKKNNKNETPNSFTKEDISDISFIGTSEQNNPCFPAFDIKLFRGNMTGSISYTTGSGYTHRHPQIHIEVTDIYNEETKSIETDEYFVLRIRELNSLFEKENFEIEMYEIDSINILGRPSEQYQSFKQLNFIPEQFLNPDISPTYFSDIPTGGELIEGLPVLNTLNSEYYFNILTDRDILNDLIYEENPQLPEVKEIQEGIRFC